MALLMGDDMTQASVFFVLRFSLMLSMHIFFFARGYNNNRPYASVRS